MSAEKFRKSSWPNARQTPPVETRIARAVTVDEPEKILRKIHLIVLSGLTINPDRTILARAVVGIPHPLKVDVLV